VSRLQVYPQRIFVDVGFVVVVAVVPTAAIPDIISANRNALVKVRDRARIRVVLRGILRLAFIRKHSLVAMTHQVKVEASM
jgi:hypothetical protein